MHSVVHNGLTQNDGSQVSIHYARAISNPEDQRRQVNEMQRQQQQRVVIFISDDLFYNYVLQVYLYTTALCTFSSICWILATALIDDFTEVMPIPIFVWIIITVVIVLSLSLIDSWRRIKPVVWTLFIIMAVACTICFCFSACRYEVFVVVIGLILAFVLISVLHLCGITCPLTMLPVGIVANVIVYCLLIAIMVLLVIYVWTRNDYMLLAGFVLILMMILTSTPFLAAYLYGRLGVVPFDEIVYISLMVYLDFIVTFYCIINFYGHYQNISDEKNSNE